MEQSAAFSITTDGDRGGALNALDANRVKRLMAYAKFKSSGLNEDGEELMQQAYLRWLNSKKPIGDLDDTVSYLIGAINSLAANAFRHDRMVKRTIGEQNCASGENSEDPLDAVPTPNPSQEDSLLLQQIFDLFAGDSDLQLLLMYQGQQSTRAEIMTELGWDGTKYEAVRKRKVRRVAKLLNEGVI